MARRKRRRRARRAAVIMMNPRRRRRRHSRARFHPRRRRRHHVRRRINPGMGGGIKGALKNAFMVGVPAIGAGFVSNFVDAKWLSDKHVVIRMGAKLVEATLAGLFFRRRPVIAFASMGAILGSIGGEFGVRAAGGVVVGSSPVSKGQGAAALITEDPRAMGVLVTTMQGMGYQLDQNVSLGDYPALQPGSYADVNLG